MKKNRILIVVEGGNIQDVIVDRDVDVRVIDWDNINSVPTDLPEREQHFKEAYNLVYNANVDTKLFDKTVEDVLYEISRQHHLCKAEIYKAEKEKEKCCKAEAEDDTFVCVDCEGSFDIEDSVKLGGKKGKMYCPTCAKKIMEKP